MGAGQVAMPVRVLVKGASTVTWTSGMGGPRTNFTYPRVLEQELRGHGRDVETWVTAMSAERTTSILRRWEVEVSGFSPDVIVLHYGHMESIHLFIPRWFERHVRGLRDRPGPVRERYRSLVLAPLWKLLVKVQQKVDRRLPTRLFHRRPRNVTALLERYVSHVQRFHSPLVVVMGLTSPNPAWRDWFPGLPGRIAEMDLALRALVERIDEPNVQFQPVWDLAEEWDARGEDPRSDGGHYTPAFHRAVGELLAERVEAWAVTQPHLTPTD